MAASLVIEAYRTTPGVILDLGCGAKPYRSLFEGRYIGCDLATGHGIPDVLGVAERLPIRDQSVDTAISTQYLEHAVDPGAVLDEAFRVLRPGGRLLLSTHGVWIHHPDPIDLWRWTEQGLVLQAETHGFEVANVYHHGEFPAAATSLLTTPLGAGQRHPRRAVRGATTSAIVALNVVGAGLDRVAQRWAPRHYASPSYLMVAHRPSVAG